MSPLSYATPRQEIMSRSCAAVEFLGYVEVKEPELPRSSSTMSVREERSSRRRSSSSPTSSGRFRLPRAHSFRHQPPHGVPHLLHHSSLRICCRGRRSAPLAGHCACSGEAPAAVHARWPLRALLCLSGSVQKICFALLSLLIELYLLGSRQSPDRARRPQLRLPRSRSCRGRVLQPCLHRRWNEYGMWALFVSERNKLFSLLIFLFLMCKTGQGLK